MSFLPNSPGVIYKYMHFIYLGLEFVLPGRYSALSGGLGFHTSN